MEHEVLFRGKDMFTGQWVEGYYFETGYGREECHYIFSGKVDTQSRYDPIYEKTIVEPSTVGQYTGLKDKSGKKIFEGDIIKWDEKEWPKFSELVIWDYELLDMRKNDWPQFCEVIGNFLDNPELLEVKK